MANQSHRTGMIVAPRLRRGPVIVVLALLSWGLLLAVWKAIAFCWMLLLGA